MCLEGMKMQIWEGGFSSICSLLDVLHLKKVILQKETEKRK